MHLNFDSVVNYTARGIKKRIALFVEPLVLPCSGKKNLIVSAIKIEHHTKITRLRRREQMVEGREAGILVK